MLATKDDCYSERIYRGVVQSVIFCIAVNAYCTEICEKIRLNYQSTIRSIFNFEWTYASIFVKIRASKFKLKKFTLHFLQNEKFISTGQKFCSFVSKWKNVKAYRSVAGNTKP